MDSMSAACVIVSVIFWIMAVLFAVLKGKAAILIAGFNTMPKAQREQYDKEQMSKDMRNSFVLWAVILGVGGILSYVLISQEIAIISIIIWMIAFFRDVHLDEKKAFGKYKLKKEPYEITKRIF